MNVKRIERFTKQLIPVNVIEGYEPKEDGFGSAFDPRVQAAGNRATTAPGAKPSGQRTFSKPGAPRKEGSGTGGGYKGTNPRSTDGARRSYGDR